MRATEIPQAVEIHLLNRVSRESFFSGFCAVGVFILGKNKQVAGNHAGRDRIDEVGSFIIR
jgi:hypothetical protein